MPGDWFTIKHAIIPKAPCSSFPRAMKTGNSECGGLAGGDVGHQPRIELFHQPELGTL